MDLKVITNELVAVLAPAVITVVTGLIAIAVSQFKNWVQAKVHSENLRSALIHLDDVVATVVNELEQTVRPAIADGKLDQGERLKIKKLAVDRVQKLIIPGVKDVLQKMGIDLEAYLESKIESYIHTKKQNNS